MSGETINVTQWFHFYSFDVMGDFAFGKSFGMLQSGKAHFALDLLHGGMKPLGLLTPMPWIFLILARIPGVSAEYDRFHHWCEQQVEERKKVRLRQRRMLKIEHI